MPNFEEFGRYTATEFPLLSRGNLTAEDVFDVALVMCREEDIPVHDGSDRRTNVEAFMRGLGSSVPVYN